MPIIIAFLAGLYFGTYPESFQAIWSDLMFGLDLVINGFTTHG